MIVDHNIFRFYRVSIPCIVFKCDSGLLFVLFVCDSLTVNQFDSLVKSRTVIPSSHIASFITLS